MENSHLPTTEAALAAIRGVAAEYGVRLSVSEDIGADRTSRRTGADPFAVLDPDGSLPHEAFAELAGTPAVTVRLFPEGDARITVDGVEFDDVPRDHVPAFLRSVYHGLVRVEGKFFPPGQWLVVSLPGDTVYREHIGLSALTPWLARARR
ncbi:hypothetical protein CTZ27_10690 [Streptomyces griseocarneus]|nr:hypothetical protein CTZ27_10690 [Streptomyces griseocarneus]